MARRRCWRCIRTRRDTRRLAGAVGAGGQFLVTEDSIQVLDVQIVRVVPCVRAFLSHA
jgi:hypothetical protein